MSWEFVVRGADGGHRGSSPGWRSALLGAVLLVVMAVFAPAASAQETGRIIGQVVDAGSGAPLSQVQVYLRGTGLGTLSRQDGRFIILNVPTGTHEVQAQRIGLGSVSQEVTVVAGEAVQVSFQMETEALGLDEIVVTGTAGAAQRRSIGNTIAQINPIELPGDPVETTLLLQAAAPGIMVSSVGGAVGQGKQIRLRGNGSVSMSNQPIIYIDGVRMMSEAFPQTTARDYRGGRGANITVSPLDLINPNAIERIEVIKGSAATTLYGTEASAGVIQIFTKSGSVGAPIWSAEIEQGVGWSREFGTEEVPYNWIDPWLRNGYIQDYMASVRGGGEALQYYVSGQYSDETGVLPLDEGEHWVVRGNFTFTPAQDLRLQWNSMYSNQWLKNTPVGNNSNGLTLNAFRQEANYFASSDYDVISQVLDFNIQQRIDRFMTGGTVTYSPLASLTNRLTIGYDFSQQEARQIRPYGFVFFPEGALLNNTWQKRILTFDYVGTYRFDLTGGLRSSFSWGGQAVGDDERELEGWGEGFPGAVYPTVSSASQKIAEEERQKVWNAGFFFQNVFDLENRYFLTLGLRVDGNSSFGEGFGLQRYPKASAAWVISDESWWQDAWGTVKLRTAYGQSGRAPGAFDAVRTWEPAGWGGVPAFVPENVGNPELGPEVTAEFEAGFDASWFDGRLSSIFTFYHQKTTDALLNVAQVASSGFVQDQLLNVGTLENQGVELSVNGSPIRTSDWGWDLGVNVTTNHSKVLDLGGVSEFRALGGWIIEGYPLPVERGEFVANPNDLVSDPEAVEIVDEHFYGPHLPTLMLSGHTTVRLPYGISISALGEYRGGHVREVNPFSISRGVRSPLCFPYYVDPLATTGDNRIKLKDNIPAIWTARCTPSISEGEFYNWDADYFKLRRVSAQVPVNFAFPDEVGNAMLTLSLNNSYLWMREIPVMDPEIRGNDGANESGLGASERVPAPITFRASLRLQW